MFIRRYCETSLVAAAAKAAGFSEATGYRKLGLPEVQAAVAQYASARLTTEALPTAVDTLITIMRDKKAPAAARVTAAKTVIDRSLGDDGARQAKEIHEMSPEELATAISSLEQQAASLAKPVDQASEKGIFD